MKPSIAVALIIMGSLVIMTPPASDYFRTREITKILSQDVSGRVTLGGGMSKTYRFGCWTAGLLMVGFAVFGSMCRQSNSRENNSDN